MPTDTAANIVAAVPNAVVGLTFETALMNDATAASVSIDDANVVLAVTGGAEAGSRSYKKADYVTLQDKNTGNTY